MRSVDESLRSPPAARQTPDIAERVSAELQRRGAFFRARVAAARERVFGEGLLTLRMAASVAVAASILALGVWGLDWVSRAEWALRTEPVLADAERVLVRLVYADEAGNAERLAWARREARKLAMPERLAEVRSRADAAVAGDLASLEAAFAVLSRGDSLPPDLAAQLAGGDLLFRASRLRRALAGGG